MFEVIFFKLFQPGLLVFFFGIYLTKINGTVYT